jgi:hypothetical protein
MRGKTIAVDSNLKKIFGDRETINIFEIPTILKENLRDE